MQRHGKGRPLSDIRDEPTNASANQTLRLRSFSQKIRWHCPEGMAKLQAEGETGTTGCIGAVGFPKLIAAFFLSKNHKKLAACLRSPNKGRRTGKPGGKEEHYIWLCSQFCKPTFFMTSNCVSSQS